MNIPNDVLAWFVIAEINTNLAASPECHHCPCCCGPCAALDYVRTELRDEIEPVLRDILGTLDSKGHMTYPHWMTHYGTVKWEEVTRVWRTPCPEPAS